MTDFTLTKLVKSPRHRTKRIINGQHVSPCAPVASVSVAASSSSLVSLSGAMTAGTLKTFLSVGSACTVYFLSVWAIDSTSRTIRLRITVDGDTTVRAFDSTTTTISSSNSGILASGVVASGNIGSTPNRIIANESLLVEVASSLSETDKIGFAILYTEED